MKSQLAGGGKKTVTTAGTAEALSASHTFARQVIIQALAGNTDVMLVGHADTVTVAAEDGIIIPQLNSITLENVFLDEVFIDVSVDGEGCSYVYTDQRSLNA